MQLSQHPHATVRGNAILGLGHIARTCQILTLTQVVSAIQTGLQDLDDDVRSHAQDAASDLKIFLGIWGGDNEPQTHTG